MEVSGYDIGTWRIAYCVRTIRNTQYAIRNTSVGVVAQGVAAVPIPGAADNFLQGRIPRLPAQGGPDLVGRGHQDGWVAGPARGDLRRDFASNHLAGRVQHLLDRKPSPVTEVEYMA